MINKRSVLFYRAFNSDYFSIKNSNRISVTGVLHIVLLMVGEMMSLASLTSNFFKNNKAEGLPKNWACYFYCRE